MRLRMILVVCAVVTCGVGAQGPSVRQQIEAANKAWFDAFVKGDIKTMDQMETDDFVFIQDGEITDKAEQIGGLRKREGKPLQQTHTVEFHKVAVSGNVAVATGFNTARDQKESTKAAFSEVWVRDGNRWRVRLAHYSTLKNDAAR